ncbi:hypothetical protein OOJ91_08615 [Micromonospora lupini]|uniref:hypothetical protein n=1 Tax=Micromonospora lupini TaxID=285679 RepID=UPI0022532A55|nr:hypothetical protein [Micromonospora lupini]MCX5065944.1 hypothetical protein [Micromonospora lupini]
MNRFTAVSRSFVAVGRASIAVLLGLLLLLSACTFGGDREPDNEATTPPPSPEEGAAVALTNALDRLEASPGLHYKGAFDNPSGTANVDLRVSGSGVAYGSMSDSGATLRILALQDRTLIRAGEAFWKSAASAQPAGDPKIKAELTKRFARSWVAIDARVMGDPGVTLRPANVAGQFRDQLRQTGVTAVGHGTVGQQQSTAVTVGSTIYHVTSNSPYRLLKVEHPRIKAANRATRGAVRGAAFRVAQRDPSDDSLDFGEMDPSALDGFYDDVENEAKRELGKAVDSRVKFNATLTGGISCPFGSGACTVRANVANTLTAAQGAGATGTVRADMTAFVTGPSNAATCTDSKTMAVNSSTSMSCVVRLVLPRCNKRGVCTWPVNANIMVIARADVNVTAITKQLRRDRSVDGRLARCRAGQGCGYPVKGSKAGAEAARADAERLASKRQQRQCQNGTVAVAKVAQKSGGGTKTIVATEAPSRPREWTDADLGGMEVAEYPGHAEASIIQWLKHNANWYIVEGAAQRNVCQPGEAPNCDVSCMEQLENVEGLTIGPAEFRSGTRYKSRIRTFWTE